MKPPRCNCPWLWRYVALSTAALAPLAAHADWQGAFASRALGITVNVQVRLPATGTDGELRFVEKACSLGLKAADNASYSIVRTSQDSDPGAYCAVWLGGSLKTSKADGAGKVLQAEIVNRSSQVRVMLRETP